MSCPKISPVVLQELPTLPNFTSCPARVPHPTLPHQLFYKSSHILHYLTSHPASVPTSYATHQLSCKCSHSLHYLTSRPTRVPTSYTTSQVVLQEFLHPTLLYQSSYKSSHILRYLISCPASVPHPTLPHQLSCKCSHILRYLTSCPASVPTSYATSPVILQVFSHPTLPHQLSHKSSQSTLPHQLSCKYSHTLHYFISCPARVPTSCTISPAVLQELPVCDQRNSASVMQRATVFVNLPAVCVIILKNNEC